MIGVHSVDVVPPVALLAEGGDRNIKLPEGETLPEVALLAEGGDRNRLVMMTVPLVKVALLAEGGDRNSDQRANSRSA